MKATQKFVDGTASVLAVAGLSLLLILAVFTLFDGLLRALASYPLDLVREIGDLVAAISGAACLPIALLHRTNIMLRAFDRVLPRRGVRAVDIFAAVVVEMAMIGMAWQFYLLAVKTMRAGDVTWMLSLPKAPFWYVVDAILWIGVAVQSFVVAGEVIGIRRIQTEAAS